MISISAVWFCLKRMPRIILLLLLFISIFLLAFLLLGCTKTSDTYASIFLIHYSFNKSSSIFPLIEKSFESKNLTNYQDMTVYAGYLSICLDVSDALTCASRSDLSKLSSMTSVDIYTVNSNSSSSTLDLVALADDFSNYIVHPYILIATIVLLVVQFLSLLYVTVPGLPAKHLINKFNLVLAPVLALLWGLGAMWAHIAADSGESLVEKASMGIVQAHVGKKASAMTWTPFTFFCIVAIGIITLHLRDLSRIIEAVDPKV